MENKKWIAYKGIVHAGLQAWWFDKKSLKNRLIWMPLMLPFFFLAMFVAIAMAVYFRDTGVVVDKAGNTSKGTIMAVVDTPYYDQIVDVVSKENERYDFISISEGSIKDVLKERKATFVLKLVKKGNDFEFTIYYDKNRNYVHKQWIKEIDKLKAKIQTEIAILDVGESNIPHDLLSGLKGDVSFESQGVGDKGGVSVLLGVMILLWNILIIAPIDYAKTTLYRLFVEDVTHDLLPTWKSAKTSADIILMARLTSAFVVYLVTSLIMLFHVILWMFGYDMLVDWLLTTEALSNNDQLKIMTEGFKEFIDGQSLYSVLMVLLAMSLTSILSLIYLIPGTLRSIDSEQARNKNKIFDFLLINIPLIGFIIGYSGMGIWSSAIPIFNAYHISSGVLSSELTSLYFFVFFASTLLAAVPLWLRSRTIMNSDNRYLMPR